MTKYVAFLRAINVGGNAIIKMTDLKLMFESAGLENVQTYIQSGNVIFETEEKDIDAVKKRIERQLEGAAGYKIHLFVRTMREFQSIVSKSPFTAKANEMVYVAFLDQKPAPKSQQALLALKNEADDLAVKGREVYHLRRDREKSALARTSIEKILKSPATVRNMTTLTKIVKKYK
ncbi:MAG TPA: DUF1697 domain-containing protein [Anaerolineales bacterium]|nr:DUF1697 domain-containing protein [Anaerolineales bacterium]